MHLGFKVKEFIFLNLLSALFYILRELMAVFNILRQVVLPDPACPTSITPNLTLKVSYS